MYCGTEKILTEELGRDGSGRVDDLEDGNKVEDKDDLYVIKRSKNGLDTLLCAHLAELGVLHGCAKEWNELKRS